MTITKKHTNMPHTFPEDSAAYFEDMDPEELQDLAKAPPQIHQEKNTDHT